MTGNNWQPVGPHQSGFYEIVSVVGVQWPHVQHASCPSFTHRRIGALAMKAKRKPRSNRVDPDDGLGRRIYKIISPFIRHEGTCHAENWDGYCDCGISEARKKVRTLLRSNAKLRREP